MYKSASRHRQHAAIFGRKKKKSVFIGPGKSRKKRKQNSLSVTEYDKTIISIVADLGCIECKSKGFYKEKRCFICPNYESKTICDGYSPNEQRE